MQNHDNNRPFCLIDKDDEEYISIYPGTLGGHSN